MKYIRTKDGIHEVIEIYTYTKKKLGVIIESLGCKTENENELKTIFYGDVLKQADTIEELCDEFVRVSKSVHDFLVSDDIPTKKFDDTEIYGAIWTDKGLIYVAKMNDKGELELLWIIN